MKILIACGASGGHIFPAISFAQRLKIDKPEAEILFVASKSGPGRILLAGYDTKFIAAKPFFLLAKGVFDSLFIVHRFNPDLVVGFGSYSCLPPVLSAILLRKRILIHEQNILPGKAVRMLAPFAARVAVSFQDTIRYFNPLFRNKVVLTGNPLRDELFGKSREEALKLFDLDCDKKTILVMGGSQGSEKINRIFIQAASLLKDSLYFQVIHISGPHDREYLKKQYARLKIDARVFDFLKEMGLAYRLADIVISRAGAMSISEIIALGKPSILVPYPFRGAHQSLNARVLSSCGAAMVIREHDLNAPFLKNRLLSLFNNKDKLDNMKGALSRLSGFEADSLLVKAALEILR